MKVKHAELIVIHSDISVVSADIVAGGTAREGEIDEKSLRREIHAVFLKAQEQNHETLAFDIESWISGKISGGYTVTPEIISKLMAQEAFRYLQSQNAMALKKILFVAGEENLAAVFEQNIYEYLRHLTEDFSGGPYLTVDGIVEYNQGIVLIERKNPPLGWALPGGFLDRGEKIAAAVVREVKEETNLEFTAIGEFKVCSDPARDPRFHTVSVVFYGKGQGQLRAASDAKNARVFPWDRLPQVIAFDHREIIEEYKRKIKKQK